MTRKPTSPKGKRAKGSSPAGGAPPRRLVTQAEYARHRGVTPEAVSQWRRKGRLVTEGEGRALRVDLEASDRLVDATRDPRHDLEFGGEGTDAAEYAKARARREKANAELAELKLAEERGRLIDRATHVSAVYDFARRHQQALLNLPARVAATLAARFGCEEHVVQQALDEVVREHLREQARIRLRQAGPESEEMGALEATAEDDDADDE